MDSLRGNFDRDPAFDEHELERGYDPAEDDTGREAPPASIGTDERRMQVRAYNYWASLLDNRRFPAVEDLDPAALPDFGPYSVLLDFTGGIDQPGIAFLGAALADECGIEPETSELADVPSRSLLSRITDHYMQILANQAPIGFEAEFINLRDRAILYRGILLPFSSDDDTIDFIYGVINWKELADQQTADELLLEIDQALDEPAAAPRQPGLLSDWADGPLAPAEDEDDEEDAAEAGADTLNLSSLIRIGSSTRRPVLPAPVFGGFDEDPFASRSGQEDRDDALAADAMPDEGDEAEMGLGDWLASARELAMQACSSEDRTRQALYAAIGRAYDFSLASDDAPEDFAELLADAGLSGQDRAPMTPVVKLVFGADYDKTRLTEYAAALSHGRRLGLPRGELAGFLARAEGGLKGVIAAERRLRREESGAAHKPAPALRDGLARALRALPAGHWTDLAAEGPEFALVMVRRTGNGEVVLLGEVPQDVALIDKAARKLTA